MEIDYDSLKEARREGEGKAERFLKNQEEVL